jgi:hypothetical protein
MQRQTALHHVVADRQGQHGREQAEEGVQHLLHINSPY